MNGKTNQSELSHVSTIAIVGGGLAGLGAARILGGAGFECTVFERRSRAGGVWTVGYHSYGLQTPKEFYEIPDHPFDGSYPNLPSGALMLAYIDGYIDRFRLKDRIRLNREVVRVERDGDGWIVEHTDTGSGETRRDRFEGRVIHSTEYQRPEDAVGRRAVVVGYGKSALDIATDLSREGRDVTLVYRDTHRPAPLKVFGLVDIRAIFMNRLLGAFLPPYHHPSSTVAWIHRNAAWFVRGVWRVFEGIVRLQYGLGKCNAVPSTPIEHDLFTGSMAPFGETFRRMRRGLIRNVRGSIRRFRRDGLELVDGTIIPADTVILATGFRQDFGILPEEFQSSAEGDGVYLYRHILSPSMPNAAFIGAASTYSNCLTSHLAALWLRDMGHSPYRKRGPIAELLGAYGPADYAALFDAPVAAGRSAATSTDAARTDAGGLPKSVAG